MPPRKKAAAVPEPAGDASGEVVADRQRLPVTLPPEMVHQIAKEACRTEKYIERWDVSDSLWDIPTSTRPARAWRLVSSDYHLAATTALFQNIVLADRRSRKVVDPDFALPNVLHRSIISKHLHIKIAPLVKTLRVRGASSDDLRDLPDLPNCFFLDVNHLRINGSFTVPALHQLRYLRCAVEGVGNSTLYLIILSAPCLETLALRHASDPISPNQRGGWWTPYVAAMSSRTSQIASRQPPKASGDFRSTYSVDAVWPLIAELPSYAPNLTHLSFDDGIRVDGDFNLRDIIRRLPHLICLRLCPYIQEDSWAPDPPWGNDKFNDLVQLCPSIQCFKTEFSVINATFFDSLRVDPHHLRHIAVWGSFMVDNYDLSETLQANGAQDVAVLADTVSTLSGPEVGCAWYSYDLFRRVTMMMKEGKDGKADLTCGLCR